MHKITRMALTVSAVAGLTLVGTLPAHAATDETTATIEVEGGVLSIVAPASVTLSAVTPGGVASGSLPEVVVTDSTADTIGWSSSVSITDFTSGLNTIPADAVTYTPATAVGTGTVTVTESDVTEGTGVVQTATAVVGNNTATWAATLNVAVPADAIAAADYSAVLTHSVI